MSANRVIDDHKELENTGTLTHDQIDKTIFETPWVVLSASVEEQLQGRRVLQAGTGISITDNGPGGTVTISSLGIGAGAKIGSPEFGTGYLDGLFSDFQSEMPVGTPIDRFNQVLRLFAPSMAPNLTSLSANSDQLMVNTYLSFDANNSISNVECVGGSSLTNINQLYASSDLPNGDLRLGTTSLSTLSGTLNFNIPEDAYSNGIKNYVSGVFGTGDKGQLQLICNDQIIHTLNLATYSGSGLPGSGNGESLNGNGSGFRKISIPQAGTFVDGRLFPIFKHRSVDFVLSQADQRKGWNCLKVVHNLGTISYQTNSIEWINHVGCQPISSDSGTLSITNISGSRYLSGVEYYTGADVKYGVNVNGLYDYVYDDQPITFTTSNIMFYAVSKEIINTTLGENYQKSLNVQVSASVLLPDLLNKQISVGVNATHPLKTPLLNSSITSLDGVLLFNPLNNNSSLSEYFSDETYRLQDKNYLNQAEIDTSGWDSTIHINSAPGYNFGLTVYDNKLMSPLATWKGGDFRNVSEGGQLDYSPSGNPDYSGISDGAVLNYYRSLKNESDQIYRDFSIVISGSNSTTIIPLTASLGSNSIKMSVKVPGKTGWLDLTKTFVLNQLFDGDGTSYTSFSNQLNTTILGTLGTTTIESGESLVLKVESLASWTGHLDCIEFKFGASSGTSPLTPPTLTSINSTTTGVSSKLSFGSSKPITGYSNPDVKNLNDLYNTSGNQLGTFNGGQNISGSVNPGVLSTAYYAAGSFFDANQGTLKLVVNDTNLVTIDLSDSTIGAGQPGNGTGSILSTNGSGFTSISSWKPVYQSDGITPDYTKIYRTAKFVVNTADQRPGANNVKIVHTINNVDRITNSLEWINDNNSTTVTINNILLTPFGHSNTYYQSGVKYFASAPTGSLTFIANNVYKNVYSPDVDAISISKGSYVNLSSITVNGNGIFSETTSGSSTNLKQLKATIDSQTLDLHITSSLSYTKSISLVGNGITPNTAAIGDVAIKHPLKPTVSSASITTAGFLIYSGSNTSTQDSNEYFVGERYRLIDGAYATQGSVLSTNNVWNSMISINDPTYPTYYNGLLIFDDKLVAPYMGGINGDFRSVLDGGQIANSPRNNVNYSTLAETARVYLRSFKNTTINDVPQIIVTLYGSGELVTKSTILSGNKIHIEIKIPEKTGWLDLVKPSEGSGNIIDGDGGLSGNLNSIITSNGVSNICTFNGQTVDGTISTAGEFFLLKITASDNWTGFLDRILVQYG